MWPCAPHSPWANFLGHFFLACSDLPCYLSGFVMCSEQTCRRNRRQATADIRYLAPPWIGFVMGRFNAAFSLGQCAFNISIQPPSRRPVRFPNPYLCARRRHTRRQKAFAGWRGIDQRHGPLWVWASSMQVLPTLMVDTNTPTPPWLWCAMYSVLTTHHVCAIVVCLLLLLDEHRTRCGHKYVPLPPRHWRESRLGRRNRQVSRVSRNSSGCPSPLTS